MCFSLFDLAEIGMRTKTPGDFLDCEQSFSFPKFCHAHATSSER